MAQHVLGKRRYIALTLLLLLSFSTRQIIDAFIIPSRNGNAVTKTKKWDPLNRHPFRSHQTRAYATPSSTSAQSPLDSNIETGNILILDHLNINHEKGRHDVLNAFYFDFLQCKIDPRKIENYISKKKTVWANIGSQQFHLPEGKPDAQVLQGEITLAFQSLEGFQERFELLKGLKPNNDKNDSAAVLKDTLFNLKEKTTETLQVTDPWGTHFNLVLDPSLSYKDGRGSQPKSKDGDPNHDNDNGIAMIDLTLFAPTDSNFAGIGRFYEQVLGAPILAVSKNECVVKVGPHQTLTFKARAQPDGQLIQHEALVKSDDENETHPSNYGPHISMYIQDIRKSYQKAKDLGVLYVNPRFKRRAYTEEEAVDQCMFRCLNIIDPENPENGIILKVEHEVRSVVTKSGSKYKSCPFETIPEGCKV